ncbi:MAG: class I SAM-dependent methyltransferase [Microcoleaceae cyanobacterium]
MTYVENQYNKAFYNAQSDGSLNSAKEILGYFFKLYQPNSVVDFGCGIGTWLAIAHSLGIQDLLGIDGLWIDSEKFNPEVINYHLQDLEQPISLDRNFDLALSLEVAEHLTPQRGESFIQEMCQASDLIIFGAAIPGQAGTNHINTQPQSYWISLFESHGYHCLDLFRPVFWNSPKVEFWYAQNTFLFVKPSHPHFNQFQQHNQTLSLISDIYHPRHFQKRFSRLQMLEKLSKLPQTNQSLLCKSNINLISGQYGYILEFESQPPLYLKDNKGHVTRDRFPWIYRFLAVHQLSDGLELLWCNTDGKLAQWLIDASGMKQKYQDLSQKPLEEIADQFQIKLTALKQFMNTIKIDIK